MTCVHSEDNLNMLVLIQLTLSRPKCLIPDEAHLNKNEEYRLLHSVYLFVTKASGLNSVLHSSVCNSSMHGKLEHRSLIAARHTCITHK